MFDISGVHTTLMNYKGEIYVAHPSFRSEISGFYSSTDFHSQLGSFSIKIPVISSRYWTADCPAGQFANDISGGLFYETGIQMGIITIWEVCILI